MTGLAKEYGAVNLSQGFPDFPISEELIDRVTYYMKSGFNQYAPMTGVEELRKAISLMFRHNHDAYYHPDKEINITAGGTQALYAAITAFVRKDDEVIIFEPAYDSYGPAVQLNGGIGYNWDVVALDFVLGIRDPSDYEEFILRTASINTDAVAVSGSLILSVRF